MKPGRNITVEYFEITGKVNEKPWEDCDDSIQSEALNGYYSKVDLPVFGVWMRIIHEEAREVL